MPNPRYLAAINADRNPGREPRELSCFERQGDRIRVPRGTIARLRGIAAEHGVPLSCVDRRNIGSPLELRHARELRDYQERAVAEMVHRQQGILVAPAGSGKTTMGCGAIARLGRSTLGLVGTVDLAEQWCAEIRAQLGIEAGMIGAGRWDVRPVTVAIVSSLARLDEDALAALHANFGVLLVDEVHHAASPTWRRVIESSTAKYRIGLTATPEREDGLGPCIEWQFGARVTVVGHAELLETGRLVPPRVMRLETDFAFPYSGPDDYRPLLDALGRTEQRIGRVMRPAVDKPDAAIVDVVDVRVGVLRYQARKRAVVFRGVLGTSVQERSA